MSLFANHFNSILEADEVDVNAADTAAAEQQAMKQQLDPTTDPKSLNVNVPPDLEATKGAHTAAQKKSLNEWIAKISEFINFLNGVEGSSVQSQLASAGCDSLFEKVASSEKKRIARVAMELSSLNESLKGYVISNDS